MKIHNQTINHFDLSKFIFIWVTLVVFTFSSKSVLAHPMPNSLILLNFQSDIVKAELELPFDGLEQAFGMTISQGTEPELREYIKEHLQAYTHDDQLWNIDINRIGVRSEQEKNTGLIHHYVVVFLDFKPPMGVNSHDLVLDYDVIIHELSTHSAFVTIQQDWENGIYSNNPVNVGVISADIMNNSIAPLSINIAGGNNWTGFKSMVELGMHHIAEGTDHLLFLLVLLFAAPLVVEKNRWAGFGGMRFSLTNLLKIVTAFTIGHSVTLLIGVLNWFQPSSQIVEILIAFSILISALHAIYPIFPRREAYIAAGFGLIHGLAFADILNQLNIGASQMALSLLGFNVGIELMQLIIIVLIMPWLILLSQTSMYKGVRIGGAVFSGVAAIAWMVERIIGQSNPVTVLVENLVQYAPWLIIIIALFSLFSRFYYQPQLQARV